LREVFFKYLKLRLDAFALRVEPSQVVVDHFINPPFQVYPHPLQLLHFLRNLHLHIRNQLITPSLQPASNSILLVERIRLSTRIYRKSILDVKRQVRHVWVFLHVLDEACLAQCNGLGGAATGHCGLFVLALHAGVDV
jgi:hypothetical protein